MSVVNGKNVVLSVNRSGQWQPVACNAVCALHLQRDFLETTFRDTGKNRTFIPYKATVTLDGSGPIEYDSAFTAHDVILLWQAAELIQWRFQLTDDKGHAAITKEYTGYGYFRNVNVTGDVQQPGMCDYEILSSGDTTGMDVGLPGGGGATEFFEETYHPDEGETLIGNGAWIGASMVEVLRNGIGLDILTGGTATLGEQVVFDSVAGTLTFGLAFGPDEYVQVIWGT